jgi:hypothetical protein
MNTWEGNGELTLDAPDSLEMKALLDSRRKAVAEETAKNQESVKKPENKPNRGDTNLPKKSPPQTRWVKNAFFNGGSTTRIRLDELHNEFNGNVYGQGDSTDLDIADEILERAGLREHVRFNEIRQGLADFLADVPDPAMKWVNPNYGVAYPKKIEPK